jgi:excisionase family DNA binding protein
MNAQHEYEELWDTKQAAAFLHVSRSWVYQRTEAGLLPCLRVGGLLRFEPAVLRDFIRQDRISSTDVMERLKRGGR